MSKRGSSTETDTDLMLLVTIEDDPLMMSYMFISHSGFGGEKIHYYSVISVCYSISNAVNVNICSVYVYSDVITYCAVALENRSDT